MDGLNSLFFFSQHLHIDVYWFFCVFSVLFLLLFFLFFFFFFSSDEVEMENSKPENLRSKMKKMTKWLFRVCVQGIH